ncbi:MAG: ATP-dependent zinc metalloprotease FtsH [Candidatus Pacebacteria bacterium]|nr:ATP-dependent zinc metalloprotease FtsH [Candidatus Paceibacterota bacterium]
MAKKNRQLPPQPPTPQKPKAPRVPKGKGVNPILYSLLVFFLLAGTYSLLSRHTETTQIGISTLASQVASGTVESILIKGNVLTITTNDGAEQISQKENGASLSETLAAYGVTAEQLQGVSIEVKQESGVWFWILNLAPILIPLIFIGFLVWMMTRQVKGAGMQAFSFGQSKARFFDPKDKQKVTFADVAGVKEAKEELLEIVDFLKSPKKFADIGARIPKGVLLMGSPGTGKTLLARAVAGEAGVPFFSISGSEFVEMFVGVGASRVRDLFQNVKRAAPAIIFIDEIDAVGRVRGTGVGGGNDEREQTLNQILVEMDGFEPSEAVIVMAATNRPDVLDPALLRPGRFDRRVKLDLPDRSDREAILAIHARKKPLAEDVVLKTIAERTPGFSGADLQSLMNEAAILAARENRTKVAQFDLIRSIEKVLLGPERRSHILSDKEKKITAYHEAGHALVASVLSEADPVHKISIISRGHAAGYTLALPLEENRLFSSKAFLDRLAMTMGGYATEMLIFGDTTTGPSNDLQVATAIARDMVTRYGMSDVVGPVALVSDEGRSHVGGIYVEGKEYSEHIASIVDREVARLVGEAKTRAHEAIVKHRGALDAIVSALIEKETLEQPEFEAILTAHGIPVKKDAGVETKKV